MNPLWLSYFRIARRGGLIPLIILVATLGVLVVAMLLMLMFAPQRMGMNSNHYRDMAQSIYGLHCLCMGGLVVLLAGIRISRAIGEEKNNGLWEVNHMTALRPWQLGLGYWIGPALREWILAGIMIPFGLVLGGMAQMSLGIMMVLPLLVITCGLLFTLISALGGIQLKKGGGTGVGMVFAIFPLGIFSALSPHFLGAYFWPTWALEYAFDRTPNPNVLRQPATFFGYPFDPFLMALWVQALITGFLWLMLLRKVERPDRPGWTRWQAVLFLAIMLLFQHGLIWESGRDIFNVHQQNNSEEIALSTGWVGSILLVWMVVLACERSLMDLHNLQLRRRGLSLLHLLLHTSLPTALLAASISFLGMALHLLSSQHRGVLLGILFVCTISTVLIPLLLLDILRIWFPKTALAWLFVSMLLLVAMPLIAMGIVDSTFLGMLSLPAPVTWMLGDPSEAVGENTIYLVIGAIWQAVLLGVLFIPWVLTWNRWKKRMAALN